MELKVYRKSVYGRTLWYLLPCKEATAIKSLTGRETVTLADLEAIRDLGYETMEVLAPE